MITKTKDYNKTYNKDTITFSLFGVSLLVISHIHHHEFTGDKELCIAIPPIGKDKHTYIFSKYFTYYRDSKKYSEYLNRRHDFYSRRYDELGLEKDETFYNCY